MKIDLLNIIELLIDHEINFVVCGGVACILQGCERTTLDLALNILLNNENIEKIIKLIKLLNLKPRIPEPIENLKNPLKRKEWLEKKE